MENTSDLENNDRSLLELSNMECVDDSYGDIDINEEEEAKVQRDFFEKIAENPMEYCSPMELFKETVLYDHSVEVIGRVDFFDGPILVNTRYGPKKVLKAILTNGTQPVENVEIWQVQFSIFQEHLKAIAPFIIKDHILHVDGAFSTKRGPLKKDFAYRVAIDLTCHKNTVVNTVGIYKQNRIDTKAVVITFADALNHINQNVEVKGYLRMEFEPISKNNPTFIGSITDLCYKLDVQCTDQFCTSFKLGECFQITGMLHDDSPPVIEITDISNIVKLDIPAKTSKEMRLGIKIPILDTNTTATKKFKSA